MTKHEVAAVLEELALLLTIKGENPFKIRAYENGARAIEGLEEDIEALVRAERLIDVPGVGKAIAEKVAVLLRTGSLPLLEELRAATPPGLLEMRAIPNFGPKRIQKVYQELGISTVEGLMAAGEDGRLAALPGFGEKMAAKILAGIRNRQAYGQRHLLSTAAEAVAPILVGLRGLAQVRRAEAAGSFRRARETVGDLDFVVAAADSGPVMQWFATQPWVMEVLAHGETKTSVRLHGGMQADLRVVPPEQYAFALHHFTGSKEHNVRMRQRALARGYSLSEWGIFAADGKHGPSAGGPGARPVVEAREEADIFQFLGLHEIPPELREDRGEIEAAEVGPLPRLVQLSDLRGAFHNHTTASDGRLRLEELAAEAEARGWEYIGVADHSKSSWQARGLDEERLRMQVAAIRSLNASGKFRVRVLAGCEVDILRDGRLDFAAEAMEALDYVVISVHQAMTGLTEAEMTARIIGAMETPIRPRKILGHLTGRLLLRRDGYAVDIRRVLEAAVANQVVVELNANPHRLDMDWRHWRVARDLGVLSAINPDAHRAEDLDHLRYGVAQARKGWLRPEDVLNTRSWAAVREFLDDR